MPAKPRHALKPNSKQRERRLCYKGTPEPEKRTMKYRLLSTCVCVCVWFRLFINFQQETKDRKMQISKDVAETFSPFSSSKRPRCKGQCKMRKEGAVRQNKEVSWAACLSKGHCYAIRRYVPCMALCHYMLLSRHFFSFTAFTTVTGHHFLHVFITQPLVTRGEVWRLYAN